MNFFKYSLIIILLFYAYGIGLTNSFNPINQYEYYSSDTELANEEQKNWCMNELLTIDKHFYTDEGYASSTWSRGTSDDIKQKYDKVLNAVNINQMNDNFEGTDYEFLMLPYVDSKNEIMSQFSSFKNTYGDPNHVYIYTNTDGVSKWTGDNWIMFFQFNLDINNPKMLAVCKDWYTNENF